MKFISIYTIDPKVRAVEPDERTMAAMGKLVGEIQASGVLDFGSVQPGVTEMRVGKSGSQCTVTDGPFTETKVVGGFAIMSCGSRDEALMWSKRFIECAGDGMSELHQPAEFS